MFAKIKENPVAVCNVVCAVLMLLLVVLQFLPFWHYTANDAEAAASIQAYIWFPDDHKALESYLAEQIDGYSINSIVLMPILHLLLGVTGLVLCLKMCSHPLVALFPTTVGGVGLWGFLSQAALRMGSMWWLQLLICLMLTGMGVYALIVGLKKGV